MICLPKYQTSYPCEPLEYYPEHQEQAVGGPKLKPKPLKWFMDFSKIDSNAGVGI